MGILFGSDAENTKKLREECERLKDTVTSLGNQNTDLRKEIMSLREQHAAQAEAMDELTAKSERLDALLPEYEKLKETSVLLEEANARIAELEEALKATPPPFRPEPSATQPESAKPECPSIDLTPLNERLDKIARFMDDNSYKDGIIKNLHKELQERTADFMTQIKRPYLKSIIRIHERLSNTLAACDKPEAVAAPDALAKTLKKMNGDVLMVQDMLDDEYDLEYFLPSPGDKYDPRAHNAIQSLPAPTPDKAGTIAECRMGGFIEQSGGKVVKPAIVTVYKADNK